MGLQKTLCPLPADFDEISYSTLTPDVHEQYNFTRCASIHYLAFGRTEERAWKSVPISESRQKKYREKLLHLLLNRAFDIPDVVVDKKALMHANALVSALDFKSRLSGFFGVFQGGRFINS